MNKTKDSLQKINIKEYIKNNFERCIFCGNKDFHETKASKKNAKSFHCENCGNYQIANSFFNLKLSETAIHDFFIKAPAILAERQLRNQGDFTFTKSNWEDFIKTYPNNFIEKMDNALINLAYLSNFNPQTTTLWEHEFAKLYIENDIHLSDSPNFLTILDSLQQEGFITYRVTSSMFYDITLTIAGLRKVSELQKITSPKKQAFIAMWFDDSTKAFREATKIAISNAGYTPYIVDEIHHNDFIMNQVLNLINNSQFVISDLTSIEENKNQSSGIRGGVYYEAGYAQGKGLPVVYTCRKDSMSRIHFDLKQMNTIFWEIEENNKIKFGNYDYIEYLTEHIIATVGKGPLCKK